MNAGLGFALLALACAAVLPFWLNGALAVQLLALGALCG